MNFRFRREKFISLSKASEILGYTSDHLAYLARENYIVAERKGRRWLTTEKAVRRYKKTMDSIGRPVRVSQQGRESFFVVNLKKLPQKFFLVTVARKDPKSGFKKLLVKKSLIEIFSRGKENWPKNNRLLKHGFSVGLAPHRLPVGKLPWYLHQRPWYGQITVLIPVLAGVILFAAFASPPPLFQEVNNAVLIGQKILFYSTQAAEEKISSSKLPEFAMLFMQTSNKQQSDIIYPLPAKQEVAGILASDGSYEDYTEKYGFFPIAETLQKPKQEATFLNASVNDKALQDELREWHLKYILNVKYKQIYR